MDGGQNFERRNVERILKYIEIPKDELFDSFIIDLFSFFINCLNNQSI